MDLLRTLKHRLQKVKLNPEVGIPVLEAIEDVLGDVLVEFMSDPKQTPEAKGHTAMVMSKLQKAFRDTRMSIAHRKEPHAPKAPLTLSHLQ